MTPERAEAIIQAYGAILETRAPSPGWVADVTKLPFSKQEIRDALVMGLKMTTNPQTRDVLKIGCIHLADWQEGVGEEDQGLDASKLDLRADPLKLVELTGPMFAAQKKWTPIVEAERTQLIEELQKLGLW